MIKFSKDLSEVDEFIRKIHNPLFHYHSNFLRFIEDGIDNVTIKILEHRTGGKIDGIMPYAVLSNDNYGSVINSLPFFGSHGGVLTDDTESSIRNELLNEYENQVLQEDALSSTIIESPYQPLDDHEIMLSNHKLIDDRVGQLTSLEDSDDLDNNLLSIFHGKTRNAIRKGLKLPLSIEETKDEQSWDWMQNVHSSSILKMGGVPKTARIFQSLRSNFGDSVTLHTGSINKQCVCGLVTIRYLNTVEYFTPVVTEEYKESQALSALIFFVMKQAIKEGFLLWNWGGTWRSQQGVYRFKSRFGAHDMPYRYFNWLRKPEIKKIHSDVLKREFGGLCPGIKLEKLVKG